MALRIVHFTDLSTGIGAGRVEVTQRGEAQAISAVIGFESVLKKELRNAVRVYRLPRSIFRYGYLGRNSVHRAGGGENDPVYAAIHASVQQDESALHVVAKVFPRVFDRLSDISVCGKVHDRIDAAQG